MAIRSTGYDPRTASQRPRDGWSAHDHAGGRPESATLEAIKGAIRGDALARERGDDPPMIAIEPQDGRSTALRGEAECLTENGSEEPIPKFRLPKSTNDLDLRSGHGSIGQELNRGHTLRIGPSTRVASCMTSNLGSVQKRT
jgi:hypothetical protein